MQMNISNTTEEQVVVLDFGFGRARISCVNEDGLVCDIETPDGRRVIGTFATRQEIEVGAAA